MSQRIIVSLLNGARFPSEELKTRKRGVSWIFNQLWGFFVPERIRNARDPVVRRRAALLLAFSFGTGPLVAFFCTPVSYYFIGNWQMTLGIFLTGLWILFTPLVLKRFESMFLACNYYACGSVALLSFLIYVDTGIMSGAAFWLASVPLLMGILAGSRATWVWASIGMGLIGLWTLGYTLGWMPDRHGAPPQSIVGYAFSVALLVGVVAYFAGSYQVQLERTLDLLGEREKELNSLLQVVSHDIAGPLSVVIGQAHLGAEGSSEPEQWDRVSRAAGKIREILDSVREMEALKQGKRRIDLEPVDLMKAIREGEFVFKSWLDDKQIKIHYDASDHSTLKVFAESRSLSNHVFNNLLSNAIKFSPRGSVIEIQARKEDESVHVWFKDQGMGMPKDLVESLFDTQAQTSRPGTEGEQGTGFGMSLVKNYLDFYGAEIKVRSVTEDEDPVNHGSTFHLKFKRAA